MDRETVYLYNGALLDERGDAAMSIPHLFSSVGEAQEWIDEKEMTVRVVKGVRKGDAIVDAADSLKSAYLVTVGANELRRQFIVLERGGRSAIDYIKQIYPHYAEGTAEPLGVAIERGALQDVYELRGV
jgi:hypothetical protein